MCFLNCIADVVIEEPVEDDEEAGREDKESEPEEEQYAGCGFGMCMGLGGLRACMCFMMVGRDGFFGSLQL